MSEGVKFDQGKIRWDLLPPEFLEGTAKVLTFGADKYGDRNWELGMDWNRPFAALMRHIWSWWKGEDFDPESGLHHLEHACCNLAFLLTYVKRQAGKDTRPLLTYPINEDLGESARYLLASVGGDSDAILTGIVVNGRSTTRGPEYPISGSVSPEGSYREPSNKGHDPVRETCPRGSSCSDWTDGHYEGEF